MDDNPTHVDQHQQPSDNTADALFQHTSEGNEGDHAWPIQRHEHVITLHPRPEQQGESDAQRGIHVIATKDLFDSG